MDYLYSTEDLKTMNEEKRAFKACKACKDAFLADDDQDSTKSAIALLKNRINHLLAIGNYNRKSF